MEASGMLLLPEHLAGIIGQVLTLDTDHRLGFKLPKLKKMNPAVMVGLRALDSARREFEARQIKKQNQNPNAPVLIELTPEQEREEAELIALMMRQ